MKIKDIDKKYQDSLSEHQRLIEDEAKAKRRAEQYRDEAEEAALAENVDLYESLQAKASHEEAVAYVLSKRIENNNVKRLDEAEVLEAWEDYASDYDKKLMDGWKQFNETKKKLLHQYAELVDMQYEACATRKRLAGYIASDVKRFEMNFIPCLNENVSFAGMYVHDADMVYCLAELARQGVDIRGDERVDRMFRTVVRREV